MYQVLKDFAGPVATIVASATAALITFYFASRQVQIANKQAAIARQQADTSLDQLRFNLFQQRYAIVKDVQDFIKLLVNKPKCENFGPMEIIPHYLVMDEARLFFPDDICSWLNDLKVDCQNFVEAHASQAPPMVILDKTTVLLNRLTETSKRFEKELEFPQLTRRTPIAH